MTHDFTGAPCQTNPDLWDQTNPADHELAKAGCDQCELAHYTACLKELNKQLASTTHTPTGTWAGQLFNEKGRVEVPRGPGRPRKKKAA